MSLESPPDCAILAYSVCRRTGMYTREFANHRNSVSTSTSALDKIGQIGHPLHRSPNASCRSRVRPTVPLWPILCVAELACTLENLQINEIRSVHRLLHWTT